MNAFYYAWALKIIILNYYIVYIISSYLNTQMNKVSFIVGIL